jgi:transcriptional regulator with XRE-family HTH domain
MSTVTSEVVAAEYASVQISEQLREAIRQGSMTRYRISLNTGIQEGQLSRFMQGKCGLSLNSLDRLVKCLGLRLSDNLLSVPEEDTTEEEMNDNGSEVAASEAEAVKGLHLFQDFNWKRRARTAFHTCNIHTLEQLLAVNPRRLLRVENVGPGTLQQINEVLGKRGLSLKTTPNMVSGSKGWTPERRAAAAARGRKNAQHLTNLATKRSDERSRERGLQELDEVIANGAIPAAQLLLECCDRDMAKRMIDLVSLLGESK